jgi:hypothetical protein
MISGYKIPDTDLVLPSLDADTAIGFDEAGAFKRIESGELKMGERLALVKGIVHAALLRNYPDLKREEVGKIVDLRNKEVLYLTCLGLTETRIAELTANPPSAAPA